MERSEAIKIINSIFIDETMQQYTNFDIGDALGMAIEALSEEPRKHGRWIESGVFDKYDNKYGRHDYLCNECQKPAISFVGGSEDWWCFHKPKFCPNCGAKMERREDNE